MCARAPAASALPTLRWCGVRTLRGPVHWALVGPFHVVRALPRVLSRSLAPSGVLWGGAARSRFPPTWLGAVRPPRGGSGGVDRHCCEGRLVSGAVPPPVNRALGGPSGSAPTCCGHGCADVGARYCPLGLYALWGGGLPLF